MSGSWSGGVAGGGSVGGGALNGEHEIEWHWVQGHTGHPGHTRADQLANRGIDELIALQP